MSTVAVIGSGISGTAVVLALIRQGHRVVVFEKGPAYPYPHQPQFLDEIQNLYENPRYQLPSDLRRVTQSGIYGWSLENERAMVVGGSATRWQAITLRMVPEDFRTKSRFGYGVDWPVDYDELEAYYCQAEELLGVSGTDEDNPFAPARSKPYPLPPFELSHDDTILAERLRAKGIVLHTTPQARTRLPYDKRPGCANIGACHVCPIGARYSPQRHLNEAVASGLCELRTDVSVRRIIAGDGRSKAVVVYQPNDGARQTEAPFDAIVLAAGAIESSRLLLLSKDKKHPDGLGNHSERVGRGFTFHSAWWNDLTYDDRLFPGRFGGFTGLSCQFVNAETRGRHAAVKIIFSSHVAGGDVRRPSTRAVTLRELEPRVHMRPIIFESESVPSPGKYVTLSGERDRFGDPFAHLHYELAPFDLQTHAFARRLNDRFVEATGARPDRLHDDPNYFGSGAHHMGGCAMGTTPADSVVDRFGAIHGAPDVLVVGGSVFPGSSGAMNPTLTMTALAMRTADRLLDQLR